MQRRSFAVLVSPTLTTLSRVAVSTVSHVLAIAALAGLCALPSAAGAESDAGSRRQDQLKAAYLLNIVKFVEWPPTDASDALVVCFYGGIGVYDAIVAKARDTWTSSRPLTLRRLAPSASNAGCHALYFDAESFISTQQHLPASTSPTLTVSDRKGFARHGGMIELFTDGNRLRFNINLASAQRADLHISSNLLQLAASVDNGSSR